MKFLFSFVFLMKLSFGEDVRNQVFSFIAHDFVIWYSPFKKQFGSIKNH